MKIQGIEIPDVITKAIEEDNLVIFAGAGVSMQPPDPLPDFTQLIEGLAKTVSPDGMVAQRYESERYESYLGRIGDAHTMKIKCAEVMGSGAPSVLHTNIVKLFEGGIPRIVTTNYDLRFEQAAANLGLNLRTFSSPALPLGNDFTGIVHLHGDICHPDEMILVDSDFGSAYVSDGWVARFLVKMFARFTVLLVGYSLRDMPMQYLARSISTELEDRVFVLENESRFFTRWRSRGITAIPFERYEQLPDLFGEWRLRVLRTPQERAHAVARIAATSERLTDYDVETLRKALEDPDPVQRHAYAKAYVQAARGFESLETLVRLGYGTFLFEDGDAPRDEVLRHWVVEAFVSTSYRELILIAEEAHRPFCGRFQRLVMEWLADSDADDSCLAFWAPFLNARSMGSAGLSAITLARVIDRCTRHEVAFAYIRMAFSMHAALRRDVDGKLPSHPFARFDIDLSEGSAELQQAVLRHEDALGMQIFMLCVDSLEEMEGLRTGQWLPTDPSQGARVEEPPSRTEKALAELCLATGRRLISDCTLREAVLEACRESRANVLHDIYLDLRAD
ncbi:MAG: SIR2 family protein [Coriobacteriales bacterium]|nr:SIR2 family protein [Coriobacteriales bacterium]